MKRKSTCEWFNVTKCGIAFRLGRKPLRIISFCWNPQGAKTKVFSYFKQGVK